MGAARLRLAQLAGRPEVPEIVARRPFGADGTRSEQELCNSRPACFEETALDAAAAQAVVCPYTGKEVDPAYEQRFFELYVT